MDIKKELENIEKLSNGQIILDDFYEDNSNFSVVFIIGVKDKNGNIRSIKKNMRFNKNTKEIVVYSNTTYDHSKVLEAKYHNSLLETVQNQIIPEIEKSLK